MLLLKATSLLMNKIFCSHSFRVVLTGALRTGPRQIVRLSENEEEYDKSKNGGKKGNVKSSIDDFFGIGVIISW